MNKIHQVANIRNACWQLPHRQDTKVLSTGKPVLQRLLSHLHWNSLHKLNCIYHMVLMLLLLFRLTRYIPSQSGDPCCSRQLRVTSDCLTLFRAIFCFCADWKQSPIICRYILSFGPRPFFGSFFSFITLCLLTSCPLLCLGHSKLYMDNKMKRSLIISLGKYYWLEDNCFQFWVSELQISQLQTHHYHWQSRSRSNSKLMYRYIILYLALAADRTTILCKSTIIVYEYSKSPSNSFSSN